MDPKFRRQKHLLFYLLVRFISWKRNNMWLIIVTTVRLRSDPLTCPSRLAPAVLPQPSCPTELDKKWITDVAEFEYKLSNSQLWQAVTFKICGIWKRSNHETFVLPRVLCRVPIWAIELMDPGSGDQKLPKSRVFLGFSQIARNLTGRIYSFVDILLHSGFPIKYIIYRNFQWLDLPGDGPELRVLPSVLPAGPIYILKTKL